MASQGNPASDKMKELAAKDKEIKRLKIELQKKDSANQALQKEVGKIKEMEELIKEKDDEHSKLLTVLGMMASSTPELRREVLDTIIGMMMDPRREQNDSITSSVLSLKRRHNKERQDSGTKSSRLGP